MRPTSFLSLFMENSIAVSQVFTLSEKKNCVWRRARPFNHCSTVLSTEKETSNQIWCYRNVSIDVYIDLVSRQALRKTWRWARAGVSFPTCRTKRSFQVGCRMHEKPRLPKRLLGIIRSKGMWRRGRRYCRHTQKLWAVMFSAYLLLWVGWDTATYEGTVAEFQNVPHDHKGKGTSL